jgi:hypothetical protein
LAVMMALATDSSSLSLVLGCHSACAGKLAKTRFIATTAKNNIFMIALKCGVANVNLWVAIISQTALSYKESTELISTCRAKKSPQERGLF